MNNVTHPLKFRQGSYLRLYQITLRVVIIDTVISFRSPVYFFEVSHGSRERFSRMSLSSFYSSVKPILELEGDEKREGV